MSTLSEEEKELIPVTWIKQYHYCPRIIYFLGVLGVEERTTESMLEGKESHIKEDIKGRRRKTLDKHRKIPVKQRWRKLEVASERLGIIGVVDEVIDTGKELAIVEVKHAYPSRKPPPGHIYQAIAYAMLAEEKINKPIRKIILKYLPSQKTFEIPITEHMKKHVIWTIKQINKILNEEKIPQYKQTKKCHGCGWQWICRKV